MIERGKFVNCEWRSALSTHSFCWCILPDWGHVWGVTGSGQARRRGRSWQRRCCVLRAEMVYNIHSRPPNIASALSLRSHSPTDSHGRSPRAAGPWQSGRLTTRSTQTRYFTDKVQINFMSQISKDKEPYQGDL